jgi:hypothetical protein
VAVRTLLLFSVLCGAGYCFYHQQELFSPPVFRETKISTYINGRELKLVTVEEINGLGRCENEPPLTQFTDLCRRGLQCSTTSVVCKEAISPRYQSMLNLAKQNNKYLHVQAVSSERRAIYTLWGVDSEEASTLCQSWLSSIFQDHKLRDSDSYHWQCI